MEQPEGRSSNQKDWRTDFDRSHSCEELVAREAQPPTSLSIRMASENKVNCQSVPRGSQNIVLNGKTTVMNDCVIRGDLTNGRVGHHCGVKSRGVLRLPFKKFSKGCISSFTY